MLQSKPYICGYAEPTVLLQSERLRLTWLTRFLLLAIVYASMPTQSIAQPTIASVGIAEYATFYLTSEGRLYSLGGNALGESGVVSPADASLLPSPTSFPNGTIISKVAGGLHQSVALDADGNVWVWGGFLIAGNPPGGGSPNRSLPFKITRDNLGSPFTSVVSIYAGGSINAAIQADGTLWIWGDAGGGILGNGSIGGWTEYPTRVILPGTATVKQFSISYAATALMSDGSVYGWGGGGGYQSRRDLGLPYSGIDTLDYTLPHLVTFPPGSGTMTAMAVSGSGARVFLNSSGQLYGYGYHGELLGQGAGANNVAVNLATPKRIDIDLNLSPTVVKVAASSTAFFAILADGSLWGWGDAAQGEVGNGEGMDWAQPYNCVSLGTCGVSNPGGGGGPYKSGWGVAEWLVADAVRLLPALSNITDVFTGNAAAFYVYALDGNGRVYSWGRNKTGNLGNGIYPATSTQAANLPNSWDVTLATRVDPLNLWTHACVVSPFCIAYPADASCQYTPGDGPCPLSTGIFRSGFE